MFKAILFDLDGTLLPMDTNEFLQGYLKLLSGFVRHKIKPEIFIPKLMDATDQMIGNLEPDKTNEEVFVENFFASTGLDLTTMMPIFERFYETDFCQLADLCIADPVVQLIIEKAVQKLPVIIATNPVFPKIAIYERLRWAEIADQPFELVTSYENMHYCKPQVEYYLEIAEKIGVQPEDCLMVGNDVEEDLISRSIGMKTFLVDTHVINSFNSNFETDYQGTLDDLLEFIANFN